jgi:hypothetical protein
MRGAVYTGCLCAKMGKELQIVYNEQMPDKIEFTIKNNRGSVKDVLQLNITDVIDKLEYIKLAYSLYNREDSISR